MHECKISSEAEQKHPATRTAHGEPDIIIYPHELNQQLVCDGPPETN